MVGEEEAAVNRCSEEALLGLLLPLRRQLCSEDERADWGGAEVFGAISHGRNTSSSQAAAGIASTSVSTPVRRTGDDRMRVHPGA